MKKERSFSGGPRGGGGEGSQPQQQAYEISPSVSRRGIGGGKAHSSSTRLRDASHHRDGAMSSGQPTGQLVNISSIDIHRVSVHVGSVTASNQD